MDWPDATTKTGGGALHNPRDCFVFSSARSYCGARFRLNPQLTPLDADPPDSFFADYRRGRSGAVAPIGPVL